MAKSRARASGANPDGTPVTAREEPWSRLGRFDWIADIVATPEGRRSMDVERLLLEATENLCLVMEREGVTSRELARRLKVSPARVSQMLDGTRNLTLATLAEAFHALGRSLHITYGPPTDRVKLHQEKTKTKKRGRKPAGKR